MSPQVVWVLDSLVRKALEINLGVCLEINYWSLKKGKKNQIISLDIVCCSLSRNPAIQNHLSELMIFFSWGRQELSYNRKQILQESAEKSRVKDFQPIWCLRDVLVPLQIILRALSFYICFYSCVSNGSQSGKNCVFEISCMMVFWRQTAVEGLNFWSMT